MKLTNREKCRRAFNKLVSGDGPIDGDDSYKLDEHFFPVFFEGGKNSGSDPDGSWNIWDMCDLVRDFYENFVLEFEKDPKKIALWDNADNTPAEFNMKLYRSDRAKIERFLKHFEPLIE